MNSEGTPSLTAVVLEQEGNKVIRPKSRASALTKKVRKTDRQTTFFKKTFEIVVYLSKLLLYYSEAKKRNEKRLKPFCDGPTDRPTDRRTDRKVGYRVA